ncbi:MAG: SO_0444 family Cu/Zn efflux transporter [Kiritimatiellia bacterium]|nr:SO_0444 family Cu/Zn efflux transporter [Kiritimatiellia bacterium]
MQFLIHFLQSFWQTTGEMAPYLLFGFFATAISGLIVRPDFIERHLGQGSKFSIMKAALIGVPLPLCSCSVIPVAVSLRRYGASRGATIAFLISTPQTGIDSIVVTYSLLGPVFTVLRPLAALISGLAGGYFIDRLTAGQKKPEPALPPENDPECCCGKNGNNGGKTLNRITTALRYGFMILPRDIGNALILGLTISALIGAFLPENFLGNLMGTGLKPMLIMMVVAIPVYVCATASVPVAAALLLNGVTPGAAFVFLMAGPATNAATIAAVWKVLGKKTALLYLLVVAVFTITFGLMIDYLFASAGIPISGGHMGHSGLPPFIKNTSAIILLTLIVFARILPCVSHGCHSRLDSPRRSLRRSLGRESSKM